MDYEQAGELKIGQVGIANLRIRTMDVERLVQEMNERVNRAPKLFGRAAVILDFGGLTRTPDVASAKALLDGLRGAGVLPVALAYGTSEIELLSQQLGLPLLAKFRAQYERADAEPAPTRAAPAAAPTREPRRAAPAAAAALAAAPAPGEAPKPGRMQLANGRSGQQLYAENCDHTVMGTVGAGAEVSGVEVAQQDVVLRHRRLDAQRQERFLNLAPQGLLLGQGGEADILLRDGRAAFADAAARRVAPHRPQQPAWIDPPM